MSLLVAEIFGPVPQGEGSLAGVKTHFVRLGLCDGAGENGWCTWCDSMYAVDPINRPQWRRMSEEEIVAELDNLPHAAFVTLSGGNPALHDCSRLLDLLHAKGYRTAIETQGTVDRLWFTKIDTVTLSPKPPSAGSHFSEKQWATLHRCISQNRPRVTLKIVVDPDNAADYAFAKEVFAKFPDVSRQYFSVLTKPDDTEMDLIARWRRLNDMVMADSEITGPIAVLPQLHVLLRSR